MATITTYAISVAIIFVLCSIIYKICLSSATFHRFNRVVILSIYALSLAAPLLAPILSELSATSTAESHQMGIAFDTPIVVGIAEDNVSPGLWPYAPIAYGIGVAAALAFTIIAILRIASIIRAANRKEINGAVLAISDADIAPFSWMKWIVVSRQDADNDLILSHELLHVRKMHSLDLLLAQLFAIFNWFNPFAWMMRRELSTQHEYAVDDAMLRSGTDARDYQMLLVNKAVGLNMGPLANCLHNSQLKKRVKMMLKMKTKTIRGLWAAAIVPVAIAAMALLNTPAMASSMAMMNEAPGTTEKTDTVHGYIDKIKVVGYGSIKMVGVGNAEENNESTLTVGGIPKDVTIIIDGKTADKSQLENLDPNDISDMTVFRNPDKIVVNTKSAAEASGQSVQLPKFKAGEEEMFRRLATMVKYPESAMKEQAQGKALVRFFINPDGTASGFEIAKSTGNDSLDAEAIRACTEALSSEWTPGKKNGEPVTATFVIPVEFKLQ